MIEDIVIRFAKGYCNEALGREVYLSDTLLTDDIIDSIFQSKEALENLYEVGKTLTEKVEIFFDTQEKTWINEANNNTLSIVQLGVLLEDWAFVKQFNERGAR